MYSLLDNLEKSFNLAWKYKILWVFSLLVLINSSFNGSYETEEDSDSTSFNIKTPFENKIVRNIKRRPFKSMRSLTRAPKVTKNVLGASTEVTKETLETFKSAAIILGIIGLPLYLIISLYGIAVGLIKHSWASGALAKQTIRTLEDEKQEPVLGKMNQDAIKNIKQLIILNVIILLLIFLGIMIPFILSIIYSFNNSFLLLALLILGYALWLFYLIFIIFVLKPFAVREVVRGNTAFNSLKESIVLVVMNFLSVGALLCANLMITLLSLTGMVYLIAIFQITWIFAPIFIFLSFQAFVGFLHTYKSFAWTRLYLHAKSN